ncbi:MAG TPA: cytochrome c [Terriglobales bacterium]|nr:cytochrome c [Terriglobales bacterium]
MKGFLLGVVVTLACTALFLYIYFAQGFAPVATSSPPWPFEEKLARGSLDARARKEAPKTAPIEPSEENLLAGAHEYMEHCAMCHGVPDKPAPFIARGEYPRPPQVFHQDERLTGDPPGETYWKIINGIRLTGMPAFDKHLSPTEAWQIALLLANADKLPASVTAALSEPAEPASHGEQAEAQHTQAHEHNHSHNQKNSH